MPVNCDDLKRCLEGHRIAAARLRAETLRRLRFLTVDQAREEYDSMSRVWEASSAPPDDPAVDRHEIKARVGLRRQLDRCAGRKWSG
jgi:hypothetical protein